MVTDFLPLIYLIGGVSIGVLVVTVLVGLFTGAFKHH